MILALLDLIMAFNLIVESINWGVKKQLELSEEVPISIKVVGTYDQLGKFSADIAALPRIVILENLRLKHDGEGQLLLDVVAKTYRYKGMGNNEGGKK